MVKSEYLTLTYGTSKARDTYGYPLVTLRDEHGKAYRTCGGGYDLFGTVLGDFIQARYQTRLRAIYSRFAYWDRRDGSRSDTDTDRKREGFLYGATFYRHDSRVLLDGACGDSCMVKIAEAIGLQIRYVYSTGRRQHKIGVIVNDTRGEP